MHAPLGPAVSRCRAPGVTAARSANSVTAQGGACTRGATLSPPSRSTASPPSEERLLPERP
jgi:hypothetical protein